MNYSDRLQQLNDAYNTLREMRVVRNWTEFAEFIGTNRASLSAAKNGDERYLTESLMSKLEVAMARLNHGSQSEELGVSGTTALVPYASMKCVPTIPIHAYRAINFDVMEYFSQTDDDLKMSPLVMQFPDTDCYYFVNSEDMSPNLRTNDLLCLSRLPDDAKVTNGDICVVNTKYQGILERFVYDEEDFLLLKSTQSRWTDMRIPKSEVFNIFRILGAIRTNI